MAHATHWTPFTLLLLAMPLTGWLMVSGPSPETRGRSTGSDCSTCRYLPVGSGGADLGHERTGCSAG